MKVKEFASTPNFAKASFRTSTLAQLLTAGGLAIGVAASIPVAPAQAVVINTGELAFNDGAFNSSGTISSNNQFNVNFNNGGNAVVTTASGDFAPLIPGVNPPGVSVPKPISGSIGTFLFSGVGPGTSVDYKLSNPLGLDFNFGGAIGTLNIAKDSIFRGFPITGGNVNFSILSSIGSTFVSGSASPVNVMDFDFSVSNTPNQLGSYGIRVAAAGTPAVPEPLTIIGTIVGGAAALRMRKKLSNVTKN
ncbi:PEP-CTERM sorting domain-containing protein [Chamaesiphon sp. VAR_48_metabat_135_sub]|uniref:PEP-CTERM sorting domain-containing protein n=1 Tax=Chamaesiphon sp. VAR_48_metabat_135_sub TaxID=2964699 RepID=UPI00286B6DB6|nr:PEP-CTERM sorting domain-containing protein [Chamaesiphon sp. VAR_48_metabat_135_sub]